MTEYKNFHHRKPPDKTAGGFLTMLLFFCYFAENVLFCYFTTTLQTAFFLPAVTVIVYQNFLLFFFLISVRKTPFSNFQPVVYKVVYTRPKKSFSDSNKQTLSETQKVPEPA